MEIGMTLCPKASLKKSCIYGSRIIVPKGLIESATKNATLAVRSYFKPITRRALRGIGNGKTRRVKGYIFIVLINQDENNQREILLREFFIPNESRKKFLNLVRALSQNSNNRLLKVLES